MKIMPFDLLIGIAFAVVCRRFTYCAWSYRFEQVKHREENSYKLDRAFLDLTSISANLFTDCLALKKVSAKHQM